ncbi:MAG: hypothetical protein ACLGH1_11645 [Gammaproteobacteria bacterium]
MLKNLFSLSFQRFFTIPRMPLNVEKWAFPRTFNPLVAGSNPARPTKKTGKCPGFGRGIFFSGPGNVLTPCRRMARMDRGRVLRYSFR